MAGGEVKPQGTTGSERGRSDPGLKQVGSAQDHLPCCLSQGPGIFPNTREAAWAAHQSLEVHASCEI